MTRLCLNGGSNINAVTKKNETPLIFAVMNKHVELVQFLLSAGADPQICGVFLLLKQFLCNVWMSLSQLFGLS
jgi:ankyrin repeat protein